MFHKSTRSVRTGYAALILVLLILELLFDPLSLMVNVIRINRLRAELPAARVRWQSHGVSDYDIDARASIPPVCWFEATLSVRGGELNAVMAQEGLHPLVSTSPKVPIKQASWDGHCPYRQFSVAQTSKTIEQSLDKIDIATEALTVSFDPEFGFVTHHEHRYGYGMGLLSPRVGDCCVEYVFSNFQPVTAFTSRIPPTGVQNDHSTIPTRLHDSQASSSEWLDMPHTITPFFPSWSRWNSPYDQSWIQFR